MKKLLFMCLYSIIGTFCVKAQHVSNYLIHVNFFPEEAQVLGYPVSNENFMNGKTVVELSDTIPEDIIFYLHSEFKIDSIISGENYLNSNPKRF